MKLILVLLCSLVMHKAHAQKILKDSMCDDFTNELINFIKKDGEQAKYYFGNGFFIYLSPYDSAKKASIVYMLTMKEEQPSSGRLAKIKFGVRDAKGQLAMTKVNMNHMLFEDKVLIPCGLAKINLGNMSVSDLTIIDVLFVQLAITYSGKEYIINLGQEE